MFLDTSCFIYLFEHNPDFSPKIRPIFNSISDSLMPFHTSIITLAEAITKPLSVKNTDLVDKYIDMFSHTPNLILLSPSAQTSIVAAQIRAEYKFPLLDSFQLALAQEANCQTFLTNDAQLKKFRSLKVQLISSL